MGRLGWLLVVGLGLGWAFTSIRLCQERHENRQLEALLESRGQILRFQIDHLAPGESITIPPDPTKYKVRRVSPPVKEKKEGHHV